MIPTSLRRAFASPLRVGQIGGRGKAAITDRRPKPPRYIVRANGGGAKGRLRLIRQLCTSLIIHGAIRTTMHRALGAQRRMTAYIRWARKATSISVKKARSNFLGDKDLATKILFKQLGPRFRERTGLCTQIIPLGPRPSDQALAAIIQIRGGSMDYRYHHAAMIAGRQLAIHARGHDTEAAEVMAKTWRAATLPNPDEPVASTSVLPYEDDPHVIAANEAVQVALQAGTGHHLHPAYAHLPQWTQYKMVMALKRRSVDEAREFDDLMRYHYDRTLALSHSPALLAQEMEEIDILEQREKTTAKREKEAETYGAEIYDDVEPLIEGEDGFAEQEAARRAAEKAEVAAKRLPRDMPRVVDEVGAQIMPRGRRLADEPRQAPTPRWARPARQLVKGQHAMPDRLQRPPAFSAASTLPRRFEHGR